METVNQTNLQRNTICRQQFLNRLNLMGYMVNQSLNEDQISFAIALGLKAMLEDFKEELQKFNRLDVADLKERARVLMPWESVVEQKEFSYLEEFTRNLYTNLFLLSQAEG